MCVYCDIATAFAGIDIPEIIQVTENTNKEHPKIKQLKPEDQISKGLSAILNTSSSTSSSTSSPHQACYHGETTSYKSQCCAVTGLYNNKEFMDKRPFKIDLQIGTNWLIEAKLLGIPYKKMKYGLTYCANVDKSLNLSLKNPINENTVLTGEKDGVVWADICRLLGVYWFPPTPPRPRLFQVFYVHKSNTLFPQRLAEIYSKYKEIFIPVTPEVTTQIENYVVTTGNEYIDDKKTNIFHAWEAYPAKFECITLPSHCTPANPCIPAVTCTITTTDATKEIAPFCSKSHDYDLYLIEITPIYPNTKKG